MTRSGILLVVLLLSVLNCFAQVLPKRAVSEELRFASYLYQNREYQDAISVLQKFPEPANTQLADSVNFLIGMNYHSLQKNEPAAFFFARVSPASAQYDKARFYAAFNYAYTHKLPEAEKIIESFTVADSGIVHEFQDFNRAGLALLQQDLKTYDSLKQHFSYRYYPFSNQQKQFDQYATTFRNQKNRSALAAGGLSAVVPGLGKVYAGQLGSGIATFIQMSVFGLQAWEGYRKGGPGNLQFQVFGSLFTVFYIGNIWGSALAVHVQKQQVYDVTRNQILFDLHIPLRTVFN